MMRCGKWFFIWSVCVGIVLTVPGIHGSALAESINSSEYFPLESGMAWTYLEDGVNSVTVSVVPGVDEYINGVATKVLQSIGGEDSGSTTNYSSNADGISEHKEYSPDVFVEGVGFQNITVILAPPMKLANAVMTATDLIQSSGSVSFTFSGLGTFPLNYDSTTRFAQLETVTVPFGSLATIKIQNSLTISGSINNQYISTTATRTFWLARYIGVVKAISTVDGVQSTMELTHLNFAPFIKADFTAGQTTGVPPQTLNFTDRSEGHISSWLWDFGDGSISTAQYPSHTYQAAGRYSVSLRVSGPGTDTGVAEIKADFIRIALADADVNDDRRVDSADAISVLGVMTTMESQPVSGEVADTSGDGRTGLAEAVYMLQYASGMGR